MVSFLLKLLAWAFTVFLKRDSIKVSFLWNLWCVREHHYFRTLLGDCFWYSATLWICRLFYHGYINVATTTYLRFPGKAIRKWSTVFPLKKFRTNQKKARWKVTFCDWSRLNEPTGISRTTEWLSAILVST